MSKLSSTLYSYQARFLPSLFVLFPLILFLILKFPDLWAQRTAIISILSSFGVIHILGELGRDAGKWKESSLFQKWGGKPSVKILRFKDTWLDPVTHNRYLTYLSKKLRIKVKLNKNYEKKNPRNADEFYEAFGKYIIERTRDTKRFSLLFGENVSYGFRRNLWAMKPFALLILMFLLIYEIIQTFMAWHDGNAIEQKVIELMGVHLIIILFWIIKITTEWVKIPADGYAARLFESLAMIEK
jgi:hypothetical protein